MEISSTSSSSSTSASSDSAAGKVSTVSFSMAASVPLRLASPAPVSDVALFPELPDEQAHLAFSRACRDAMIARFERVDPSAAADEITSEYVEVTVA